MARRAAAFLLAAALTGAAQACSCRAPDEDEAANMRDQWQGSQAVVIAEVVGESSEPSTSWFSRDHVLGFDSPRRRRHVLHLVVKHRWKGELSAGASFLVDKIDGAMCGYESWQQSSTHLLYLRRGRHWVAGLCGLSHPVLDTPAAIKQLDAEIAKYLGEQGRSTP